MRVVALAVALSLLAGCSDGFAPVNDLSGEWVATRVESSVALRLVQHGNSITGSGSWQKFINPPSGNLAIDGTYLRPHLTLTLHYDNGTTSRYTAIALDPEHIVGSEAWADGTTDSLTFMKQ